MVAVLWLVAAALLLSSFMVAARSRSLRDRRDPFWGPGRQNDQIDMWWHSDDVALSGESIRPPQDVDA